MHVDFERSVDQTLRRRLFSDMYQNSRVGDSMQDPSAQMDLVDNLIAACEHRQVSGDVLTYHLDVSKFKILPRGQAGAS